MQQKVRYQMDFSGNWLTTSAFFAGLAFFLRVVYYFGFLNISDCSGGELALGLIVPLVLLAGYMILLRGFRCNLPQLYGLFAVAYCLLMILWTSQSGGMFHIILAIIWYVLTAAVCLGTVGGYFPYRIVMLLAFLLPVLYRFFFFDLHQYLLSLSLVAFLPEAAALSGLGAFACLAYGLKATPVRPRHTGPRAN